MINLEKNTDRTENLSATENNSAIQQQPTPPGNTSASNRNAGRVLLIAAVVVLALGLIYLFVTRSGSERSSQTGNTSPETAISTNKRSFGQFSYQRYENFRGWSIYVPSFMHHRGVPENGDGLSFYWDNMNYLQAYGYYNYGITIDELYKEDIASVDGTIAYKIKNATWYVLSGYTSDGLIYYKKVAFLNYDGLDVIATAKLINEPTYKTDFDPVIKYIFQKFPR